MPAVSACAAATIAALVFFASNHPISLSMVIAFPYEPPTKLTREKHSRYYNEIIIEIWTQERDFNLRCMYALG
ncbi:hypothetical protein Sp245p_28050 (plasmid) [Azospirillum baldaniorum]|uniref:Secreted protein n=1 Tax=Azospirillum baldaniorum TaxID=1064539 RepID=A0A9P1JXU2_9PROT|nr:hypothetical protein Sp245p_28050 [Azospirillum baldaniorum]CCD01790.1 exported protein of unknown function [Azospirillum baldaniorum]